MLHPTRYVALVAIASLAPAGAHAQGTDSLPADIAAKVSVAVQGVIAQTQVPSASVGIVENGRIVYVRAFGMARINPPTPGEAVDALRDRVDLEAVHRGGGDAAAAGGKALDRRPGVEVDSPSSPAPTRSPSAT